MCTCFGLSIDAMENTLRKSFAPYQIDNMIHDPITTDSFA